MIEEVSEAWRREDHRATVEGLLTWWREVRHPTIADALERVSAACTKEVLGGRSVAARREAWSTLAASGGPLAVDALCAHVPDTTWKASYAQLRALERYGDDPRIAQALGRAVRDRRWKTRASERYFGPALERAVAMRDVRLLDVLPVPEDPRWGFPEFLAAQRATLEAFEVPELPENVLDRLRALAAKSDTLDRERFLAAVFEQPDADGPRAVYADLLAQEGDPRGAFIQLQLRGTKSASAQARKVFQPDWVPEAVRKVVFARDSVFERGFLAQVTLDGLDEAAFEDPSWATVRRVHVRLQNTYDVDGVHAQLTRHAWFCALQEVHLPRIRVPTDGPPVGWVTLSTPALGDGAWSRMPNLRRLRLFHPSSEDLDSLLARPEVAQLEALHLVGVRIDDERMRSLPATLRELVLEDGRKGPFETDPRVIRFARNGDGWTLTLSTQAVFWFRGPAADVVELVIDGRKPTFTAELREDLRQLVARCPKLEGQTFPWDEEQGTSMRSLELRFAIGAAGLLDADAVMAWLDGRPFGYAYDTLHVNMSAPRRLQKDALAHVKRFLTKPAHRSLAVSEDGRKFARAFRWARKGENVLHTDGEATPAFVWSLQSALDDLVGRLPILFVQHSSNVRERVRPVWGDPYQFDFNGWLTVIGRPARAYLEDGDLEVLGDIDGVTVSFGDGGVFVYLAGMPDERIPRERQRAAAEAVSAAFVRRWTAVHGDIRAMAEATFGDAAWTWSTPFKGKAEQAGCRVEVQAYDLLTEAKLTIALFGTKYRTPRRVNGAAPDVASIQTLLDEAARVFATL